MAYGWRVGEKGHCVLSGYNWPLHTYLVSRNKISLTSRELEPTRNLKNLEHRRLSPQLKSFMASLVFAYLYLHVSFYTYSWPNFFPCSFVLLANLYAWYDLVHTKVDESPFFFVSHVRAILNSWIPPFLNQIHSFLSIIILYIITLNIYYLLYAI